MHKVSLTPLFGTSHIYKFGEYVTSTYTKEHICPSTLQYDTTEPLSWILIISSSIGSDVKWYPLKTISGLYDLGLKGLKSTFVSWGNLRLKTSYVIFMIW